MQGKLGEMDLQSWEKETASVLAFFLEHKGSLLGSQTLTGYREAMALLGNYQL